MDLLDTPQIITHIENNLNHSLFDCKWIPCSAKFVVIGSMPRGTGTIEIYEITAGEAKKIKEIERPNSFKCGTFGASSYVERRLATGDFKGTLEIWDLEKSCQLYITKEHTDIINSIDGMGGNTNNCGAPEIVTGSRDEPPAERISRPSEIIQKPVSDTRFQIPTENKPFEKLINGKIQMLELKRKIMEEELEEKHLKRQMMEAEMHHQNEIYELEKKEMLLKCQILEKDLYIKNKLK